MDSSNISCSGIGIGISLSFRPCEVPTPVLHDLLQPSITVVFLLYSISGSTHLDPHVVFKEFLAFNPCISTPPLDYDFQGSDHLFWSLLNHSSTSKIYFPLVILNLFLDIFCKD